MVKLDEAHSALDHPPRQQRIGGETRLARPDAIKLERCRRLTAQIHQIRCARLHTIGHLVGVEPRQNLRIARHIEPLAVERSHRVVKIALLCTVSASRTLQIEDRIALATKWNSLE